MADRADRTYRDVQDAMVGPGGMVNSLIGEGTRFRGEFDLEGLLRIDGDFEGTVRTKGRVLVGRNGRAACTINAGTVVIGGAFRGEIIAAEKVIVLSTGLVLGNISTPRLVMEEGVLFNGTCSVAPGAAAAGSSKEGATPGSADQSPDPADAGAGPTAIREFRIVQSGDSDKPAAGGA